MTHRGKLSRRQMQAWIENRLYQARLELGTFGALDQSLNLEARAN
jgi:hypothetical protein